MSTLPESDYLVRNNQVEFFVEHVLFGNRGFDKFAVGAHPLFENFVFELFLLGHKNSR